MFTQTYNVAEAGASLPCNGRWGPGRLKRRNFMNHKVIAWINFETDGRVPAAKAGMARIRVLHVGRKWRSSGTGVLRVRVQDRGRRRRYLNSIEGQESHGFQGGTTAKGKEHQEEEEGK